MTHTVRFLTISFFVFLSIAPLSAQKDTFKRELYLGVGGGMLLSNMDFVPNVPTVYKQGVYGGISAKYISEKYLGLLVELNYAQRGWEEDFGPDSDFSYSRSLDYIELPFMTHIYFGKKTRFILNIGPQISLLVGDREDMNQALADNIEEIRANNPDARVGMQYDGMYELKPIDYGLVGGVGMELKTGIGDFDIEGRYYFGLGDIFTSRRSDEAYFSRSAARIVEVKMTYYMKVL